MWINLHVILSSNSSSPSSPHKQQRIPRKPGPAHLRRRARREEAQAREAAENVAINATSDLTPNIAENTTAVQADKIPACENLVDSAEEAGPEGLEKKDTEEADPKTRVLNVKASPWPDSDSSMQVQDTFCPDHQFLQKLVIPEAPRNHCSFCGKTFGSEKALTNHIDRQHNQPHPEQVQAFNSIT